jgi:HK97 family phage major capsid protein
MIKIFENAAARQIAVDFVRALSGDDPAAEARLARAGHPLTKAASEGINSAGGFLVPTPMMEPIIRLREERGVFRRNARVIGMSSDSASRPRRTGGLTATFTPEATAATESSMTWDNVGLVAKKLLTFTRTSSELSEDSVDIAEQITSEVAYAFASKEDDCGFNGDGTSTFGGIRGITKLLIDGNHDASKLGAASTHNTYALLDIPDLTTLLSKLPSYALDGARWYISLPAFALCFARLGAAGGAISSADVGGRRVMTFLGLPVEITNVLPTTAAAQTGAVMLLVGDLSLSSTLAERRGITVATALTRYMDNDQIGIRGTERIDIVNHDLGDNTNAGPIVGITGTA